MSIRLARHLILLGSTLLLCACADSPQTQYRNPPGAVVWMHMHSFEPRTVTVRAGETVRWQNRTLVPQTVTATPGLAVSRKDTALPPGADPIDSGNLHTGETYDYTFTVPGTYRFFSKPNELNGMVGEVIVVE